MDWIPVTQDRDQWPALMNAAKNLASLMWGTDEPTEQLSACVERGSPRWSRFSHTNMIYLCIRCVIQVSNLWINVC